MIKDFLQSLFSPTGTWYRRIITLSVLVAAFLTLLGPIGAGYKSIFSDRNIRCERLKKDFESQHIFLRAFLSNPHTQNLNWDFHHVGDKAFSTLETSHYRTEGLYKEFQCSDGISKRQYAASQDASYISKASDAINCFVREANLVAAWLDESPLKGGKSATDIANSPKEIDWNETKDGLRQFHCKRDILENECIKFQFHLNNLIKAASSTDAEIQAESKKCL